MGVGSVASVLNAAKPGDGFIQGYIGTEIAVRNLRKEPAAWRGCYGRPIGSHDGVQRKLLFSSRDYWSRST